MTDDEEILSRHEVLVLLSAKARKGQTGALIALERALLIAGPEEEDEVGEAIDRILARNRDEASE